MGFFDGITSAVGSITGGDILKNVAAPLIGTVGSLIGGTNANNLNRELAAQANAFNAAQTDKQMDFQRDMRATQYQTAVSDMKAAGLSPMLAYSQGGAGNVSGSSASAVNPPRMENVVGNAVNTALTAAQTNAAILNNDLIRAQTQKADTESDNIQADTVNKLDTNPNIKLENKRMLSDIAFKDTAARLHSANAAREENYLPMSAKIGSSWNSSAGTAAAYGRLIKENTPGIKAGLLGEFGIK